MINQKARQQATSSVDKDFYKLLNDRNFGIYYRNNIDNCIIEPLYDDIDQISCIEKLSKITYISFIKIIMKDKSMQN